MFFQVLSSGSKGNLTYIESNEAKILIDAGISYKEIQNRTDIDIKDIDAIFVTHEHSDHVKFLETIARRTHATIYINELSLEEIKKKYFKSLEGLDIRLIEANQKLTVKDVKILTLNLQHDAKNCLGYIFVSNGRSLAYCTDTGFIPLPYIEILKNVNSFIVEANHDVEMLMNSKRPWFLKERILSVNGHMSNQICGEILNKILNGGKLEKVVLAHLSEECNTEQLAVDTVLDNIKCDNIPEIYVAKQYEALPKLEV